MTRPHETAATSGSGLRVRGLNKTFPGIRALRDMDLDVETGTIHALLGHNGCGKSTFVKILAGFHQPDRPCEAEIDGEELELGSAADAERLGIRFVHQELGLVLELGAADNIGLGLGYVRHGKTISWRQQNQRTNQLLRQFDIHVDPTRPLADAPPSTRTAVAIVRAVAGWEKGRGLLVLDEPTAALPAREVEELFRIVNQVRDSGTPVLLISHRLDEVVDIADRATVMRSGEVIWKGAVGETSVKSLTTLIAGAEVEAFEEHRRSSQVTSVGEAPLLQLDRVTGRYLLDVSMKIRKGEIVGVAGLLGSGREEFPYVVAGASTAEVTGTIAVDGQPIAPDDINAAQAQGVVLVPPDRATESVIETFDVRENLTLAALPKLRGRLGTIAPSRERRFAHEWLEQVKANPETIDMPINTLSGGNQQKAILARWLSTDPRILVLSEPTAGIDVGARASIYEELRMRADEGLTVLMSSSDPEDLIAACDRVIVLRDGQIAAELSKSEVTKTAIVGALEGVHEGHVAG